MLICKVGVSLSSSAAHANPKASLHRLAFFIGAAIHRCKNLVCFHQEVEVGLRES